MSTRKRFIAFIATLALLTACIPVSPMYISAADLNRDTSRTAATETGFAPTASRVTAPKADFAPFAGGKALLETAFASPGQTTSETAFASAASRVTASETTTDFAPYAAANPDTVIITQVAEYGQEVVGLALDLGSVPTWSNLGATSMSALSVEAINTLDGKTVYNGTRTITNLYLNDKPELSNAPVGGQYLIIELKHGFNLSAPGSIEKATTLEFSGGVNKPLDLNYYVKVVRDVFRIPALALNTVHEKKASQAGIINLTVDKFTAGKSADGLNYSLYSPANPGGDIPLIVWLHSEGEGTYSPDGLTQKITGVQLAANKGGTGWVEAQEAKTTLAAYVLAPQADVKGNLTSGAKGTWDWRDADAQRRDDVRIDKLIKELTADASNKIDKNRIYLAGAADGGGQVLSQLIYSANTSAAVKFAGGIVNCPALSIGMGAGRGLSKADLEKIKDIPLWFYQAKDDPKVHELGTTNTVGILGMLDSQEVIYTHPQSVTGTIAGNTYNNHLIWMRPLNNQEEILGSGDTKLTAGLTSAANDGSAPTKPMEWLFSQTREEYTVEYDSDGGTQIPTKQAIKHGGKATPGLTTKTGELFSGWEDESNNSSFDTETTPIIQAMKLKALWNPMSALTSHIVTFDSAGGSLVKNSEVPDNFLVSEPSSPTKPGHVFGGWYKDGALQNEFDFSSDIISSDVTLHAKWEVQAVLLFKSEGAARGLEPMKLMTKGALFSSYMPTDPTRGGFSFRGWKVNGNEANNATTLDEEVNIAEALWTPYYATLDLDGGKIAPPYDAAPHRVEVNSEGRIVIDQIPTKAGVRFKEWVVSGTGLAFDFNTVLTANIGLKATWSDSYSVRFHGNGGNWGSDTMKELIVDVGNTPTAIRLNNMGQPTRANYTFSGWFDSASGGTKVNFNTFNTVTAGAVKNVYAQWQQSFTVTYDTRGGSAALTDPLSPYLGGTVVTVLSKGSITRPNHVFKEWNTKSDGKGRAFKAGDKFTITSNAAFYAIWNPTSGAPTFKVTYSANGGTGTLIDTVSPYVSGEAVKVLSPGGIVRAGYTFTGWNTSADGKGTAYAPGATFKITKDTTLYAIWSLSANTVFLTYDINGGTGTLAYPTRYAFTSGTSVKVITPTGISRRGFNFVTWNTKRDGTGTNRAVSSRFAISKTTTLYAIWRSTTTGGGGGSSSSGGSGSSQNKPGSNQPSTPSTPSGPTAPLGGFTDYGKISSWALSCFERLIKDGIFKGYTDGTLRPQGNVTRAEFTKLIVLGLKIRSGGTAKYFPDDVKAGDWYKEYVDIASANNIVNGISATSFAPNANISRQDLAAIAYRTLAFLKVGVTAPDGSKFPDDWRVADYAKDAVYGLKQIGIISGRTDGNFDPTAFASREETAKIICGLIDYIAGKTT